MENMEKKLKEVQSNLVNFRKAFTVIVILNLIFLILRSIFDFMGFMYGMILADMFYLIFLIIGLFGAFQYRVNYVAVSTILSLLWIAWNLFIVCVYLNVGFLDRYNPIVLNMNTNMKSWWFTNSIGCNQHIQNRLEKYKYEKSFEKIKNELGEDVLTNTRSFLQTSIKNNHTFANRISTVNILEEFIDKNCLIPFYTIEIVQSGILIFLSVLYVIFGILLANAFNEDEEAFDYIGGFDSVHVYGNSTNNENMNTNNNPQQQDYSVLAINPQIRLEPLYTANQIKTS